MFVSALVAAVVVVVAIAAVVVFAVRLGGLWAVGWRRTLWAVGGAEPSAWWGNRSEREGKRFLKRKEPDMVNTISSENVES